MTQGNNLEMCNRAKHPNLILNESEFENMQRERERDLEENSATRQTVCETGYVENLEGVF